MTEDWRKELDDLNAKLAKKPGSDLQIIAANKRQSKEYQEKLSKSLKGRIRTEEEIEKWRESYNGNGERNPMWGKNHTSESKATISEKKKGQIPHNKGKHHKEEDLLKMRKPRSEEGKANMRGPREKKTCPHCGFIGGGGSMMRFHFDNCKQKG